MIRCCDQNWVIRSNAVRVLFLWLYVPAVHVSMTSTVFLYAAVCHIVWRVFTSRVTTVSYHFTACSTTSG